MQLKRPLARRATPKENGCLEIAGKGVTAGARLELDQRGVVGGLAADGVLVWCGAVGGVH